MTETETEPDVADGFLPPLSAVGADLDELRWLMLAIDKRAQRAGWDLPAQGFVLYDHRVHSTDQWWRRACGENPRLGPAIRSRWMSAQTFVTFDRQTMAATGGRAGANPQPYELLWNMAKNLAFADPREQVTDNARMGDGVSIYRQPGIFGFAFQTYVWLQTKLDRDKMMAVTADPPPDFSKLPGSLDTRVTTVVDLTRNVHEVRRVKGQSPTVLMNRGGAGDISTSLRMFAAAATGTVPASQEEYDAQFPRLRVAVGLEDAP